MRYIKELDSIRALAVFLVIIWHWIPRGQFIQKFLPGPTGVDLFFVLSGFLITQILLSNRNEALRLNGKKSTVLTSFYIRRILRIVPIYILTIFATVLLRHALHLGFSKEEFVSSVTYTTNFFVYSKQAWPLATPHFWSLAVEEQFYLVWPLLMLFLPKKYVLPAIVGFIAIGFISQSFAADPEFSPVLPNSCLDCLGAGALIAWILVYHPQLLSKFYKFITVLMIVSLPIFALDFTEVVNVKQLRFLHAIWGTWIIVYILLFANRKTAFISILSNRFLRSVGKVSYGIYLYHVLYFHIAIRVWYQYLYPYLPPVDDNYLRWLFLILNFFILYFLCLLSWRFIERPILSLKRIAGYQKKPIPVQPYQPSLQQ
jgi:peptidoglycan/LPS O-acetylase OafA/YrhL